MRETLSLLRLYHWKVSFWNGHYHWLCKEWGYKNVLVDTISDIKLNAKRISLVLKQILSKNNK